MKRFTFPKTKRLVTNGQFRAVLDRRIRANDELLILYIADNEFDFARLGVSVGKACGNAVVRNRMKRLMREVFRQCQGQIAPGRDYLLIVSPKWLRKSKAAKKESAVTFEQVKSSFLALVADAEKKQKSQK